MDVLPFSKVYEVVGHNLQSNYLANYLTELNAKTIVIESNYIDKDYLIDYCNFYARSFEPFKKETTRLHFFSKEFPKKYFEENFHSNDTCQKDIKEAYLGFIVIKPIKDSTSSNIIGRTLLRTRLDDDGVKFHYTKFTNEISLFGIRVSVESLPYQMQDSIVAACATTAIWTSINALNSLFGTLKQSPFEITKASVYFPGNDRNFPNSAGLNIFQIKEYFNSIGLEIENIDVEMNPDIVSDVIKAYINYKLPIIATIKLERKGIIIGYHAVVISGYSNDEFGKINKIFLHDDGVGPYCGVSFINNNGNLSCWKNELCSSWYDKIQVEKLLIPLYTKIRYPFQTIYAIFSKFKQKYNLDESNCKLLLTDVNSYKEYLLGKSVEEKSTILTLPFPKYIWVIRYEFNGLPRLDLLVDATTVHGETFRGISYIN